MDRKHKLTGSYVLGGKYRYVCWNTRNSRISQALRRIKEYAEGCTEFASDCELDNEDSSTSHDREYFYRNERIDWDNIG